jgi:trans-2,3-dihydro-3-hydroxyanthranilate isomerase
MRSLSYLHLDVFTERPLEGNQLAVFTDGVGVDAAVMQRIAREMAFPETTFVLPKEDPATDVRMRIFTPSRELPMAGHPTVGSTFALAHTGVIKQGQERFVFGLGVGPTRVDLDWTGDRLAFAWMYQQRPTFGDPIGDAGGLAAALGLDPGAMVSGLPVQEVSCGLPFLMVPIATAEAVDSVEVDGAKLKDFERRMGLEGVGFFVFSPSVAAGTATAHSRMFAPDFGVVEDPATGAASGPLGCYLVHHGVVPDALAGKIVSNQGVRMGRPSQIHIAIGLEGKEIAEVKVGGQAVVLGEGTLSAA